MTNITRKLVAAIVISIAAGMTIGLAYGTENIGMFLLLTFGTSAIVSGCLLAPT